MRQSLGSLQLYRALGGILQHSPAEHVRRPAVPAGAHPHMLRHTYVTTSFDAGVDLRDVQIAAHHADPRITMRYDRARKNLDRHPNYILAAFMTCGACRGPASPVTHVTRDVRHCR